MFGRPRQFFNVAPLPKPLPPLPSKAPAGELGADFDVGFEPMGDEYNKNYYQRAFSGPPSMMGQSPDPWGNMQASMGSGPGGGDQAAPWWMSMFNQDGPTSGGGGSFGGPSMWQTYLGWF